MGSHLGKVDAIFRDNRSVFILPETRSETREPYQA